MITIPKQLQKDGINFVLIGKGEKKPFQQAWQTKTIRYDDSELLEHLSRGNNYGVRGGGSRNLVIIDFDDIKVQEELLPKLPKTFTVKTGSGMLHLYYFSDKSESFKIFDAEMNTLADIQGEGKQVVGAGSIHPNGNHYEIIDDFDIEFMNYGEICALIMPYDKKPKKEKKDENVNFVKDSFTDKLKQKINIKTVLDWIGISTGINPTQCFIHESKGGKCLGFNEETAHCFHCDGSWNIFSLVMEYKKCTFKEALDILASLAGMEKELEEHRKQLKSFSLFTRKGQAEKLGDVQPYFYDKTGMFWLWDDDEKRWAAVDEIDVLNMIEKETGKDVISSKNRNEIINSMKQQGRKQIPKPIKPNWIQFKNKIVDIITGEEFEATPEYFVTNPIPYELHPDKFMETPVMDKIFESWVGKEYVQTLYEIIAYSLLPSYPIHRLFCFVGSGMNGKSKFIELTEKFIGHKNVTSTELDTLLESRFEVTRLYKKLLCVMGETNFSQLEKTSIIKKLTGGDLIGFEYKNKTPFEENNYAKIIIATNNLPSTTDKTIGFYRRWLIIDFPNQFSEEKDILADIPEEEYQSLALKCCGLLKDLTSKRKFHNEGEIEDRMKKFEDRSNPLDKFLKECVIIENPDEYITCSEFNKKLTSWLIENRMRQLSEVTVGRRLKDMGIDKQRKYFDWMYDGKGGQLACYFGLKWRN